MNHSWNNSPNSSPGFVYFNKSFQNPDDTSEFLSFDSTPTKSGHNFSPSNHGPKYHSSPRKFNLRNSYRYSGGNHGHRSPFYSPNNSYNSNHNNSRGNRRHNKSRGNFNNSPMMSSDGKKDMSNYFDHTCTWDPWTELEQELNTTREEEAKTALENSLKGKDIIEESDVKEENGDSSSEESSDSEESTSSVAEEETT